MRSSTSTQLRTELKTISIPAGSLNHYDNQFNGSIQIVYTFSSAFSSAPTVVIGNRVSGDLEGITMEITNVTASGFTLWLENYTGNDFSWGTTSYNVMAIGPE